MEKFYEKEIKQVPEVNGWREVINLPVVISEKQWDLGELENVLREAMEAIVKKSLADNDGKIYTTLSGGVDSSLALAMIAEICPPDTEIHTFTLGGSQKHPDIQFARQVARQFNTIHHEFIIDAEAKKQTTEEFRQFFGDSPATDKMLAREDVNTWLLYRLVAETPAKSIIAHDGIDELMGGYWRHRESSQGGREKQEGVFKKFWRELESEHLLPLEEIAEKFGIKLLLPYLQKAVVQYISAIPVNERASFKSGKMPLKAIAEEYVWPKEVVHRKKIGFVDATKSE